MTREEYEAQRAIMKDVRSQFPDVAFPEVYLDNVWRGFSKDTVVETANRKIVVVEYEDKDGHGEYEAAVVSDEYQLIPPEVSIYHFMNAVEKTPEFGAPKYHVHLLGYGEKLIVEAEFPDLKFDIPPEGRKVGDVISAMAKLFHSVDTSWEHKFRLDAKVLRCSNGMVGPKTLGSHSQKHRMNLDVEVQMKALSSGLEKFSEQHDIWKKWTEKMIAYDQVGTVLNELPFSDKQQEEILALPETGTGVRLKDMIEGKEDVSMWQLNSLATQFLTHELDLTPARVKREETFTKTMHKIDRADDFFRRAAA